MALDNNMRMEKPGELLQEYQSGAPVLSDDEKPKVGNGGIVQPSTPSYRDILRRDPLSNTRMEDYTEEAKEAGFGLSRYDTDFYPGMDLEESRAIEQSGFAKIGTGLIKGGITAATTAANTTLGTVFGLGSSLFELAADNNGNGRSFMDTMDAGVNNWLSNQLVKIQNWAEEAFPNYRTAEERSEQYQREWWKHMGTANFIGDSILKNFGFTVGAMVGGMAWSKLIGAGLSKQLANNIMKGAVAAAEGDAEVSTLLREAAEAVKKGIATDAQKALARAGEAVAKGTVLGIDADALVANIDKAARALNKYGAKLQLYGAAVGAMGEGTVEGIMAKNEFLEEYNRNWEQQYANDYQNIQNDVLSSGNPDWVSIDLIETPDGIQKRRVLTDAGMDEVYKRRQKVTADYQAAKDYAEQQGDRLSSTTFLLNLPILTASNAIQFGRMLSGGWKTARNTAKGLGKGLSITGKGLSANYDALGNVATRTILGSLKVAGSESFEEMAQGTISSGAKEVASRNLATFNNDGFDAEAIGSVRDWFSGMYAGGKEYLADTKNWQEGAIGALTGLFGIPGRNWNGGVIGEYKDAKNKIDTERASAKLLNDTVNSKEFQDRWRGYIRHLKYDNDMEKALKKDSPYEWHNANDRQLANDVIMFADAGRLEDLEQIASYYSNMSVGEAASIKSAVENGKEGAQDYSWTKNLSPEQIVSKVKDQAKTITDTIEQYRNFYENMSARAPMGSSPELLKEMVFTAMQIKSYEKRFLEMLGETMTAIEPLIEAQSVFDQEWKVLENANDVKKRGEELRRTYENIFSFMGMPVKVPKAVQNAMDNTLNFLEGFAAGDNDLVNKIKDMRKLSNSRSVFYQKLITLQEPSGQEEHQKQAVTQEQVNKKSEQKMKEVQTEGLTDFNKVREDYLSKNANERIEFFKTLESQEDKNPAIKQFADAKRTLDGFASFMTTNPKAHVPSRVLDLFVKEILRKVRSFDEIKTLPDDSFPTFEEYAQAAKNPFSTPSREGYERIKREFRDGMNEYLNMDTSTQTRNTVSPTPIVPNQSKDEKPTGQDASQPASAAPAPVSPENPPTPPAPPVEPVAPAETPRNADSEQPSIVDEFKFTKMAPVPTATEAANDAMNAEAQPEEQEEEEDIDGKIPLIHQSLPEVSTEQATIARESASGREDADLSDFIDYLHHAEERGIELSEEDKAIRDDPEFERIWNAVKNSGSFDYIATKLKAGDEIEFVILPESQFPYWKGRHQILLRTTDENGNKQILTILHSSNKNGTYFNLRELRDAIEKEYREYLDSGATDEFVFSKKSRVWAKRAGQIDYDFSDKEKFSHDTGIQNISGYSKDAPIVFINRMGNPIVVRGDKNLLENIPNELQTNLFGSQRPGSLYYLADNGDDGYIPVRLYVEHFNKDTVTNVDNPLITSIKSILSSIASQTRKLDKNSDFESENQNIWDKKESLLKLLCLDNIYFELGNYENIGPALKLVTWTEDPDTGARVNRVDFRRADQITDDWLVGRIADENFSFQIHTDEYGDVLENLDEYIENNILTSNAKKLRAKGVDFYAYPWDTESEDFKPANARQHIKKERATNNPANEPSGNAAPSNAPLNPDSVEWANGNEADMSATRKNNPIHEPEEQEKPKEVPEVQFKTWDDFDDEWIAALEDSGWHKDGPDGWDAFVEKVKNGEESIDVYNTAIECAGAMLPS